MRSPSLAVSGAAQVSQAGACPALGYACEYQHDRQTVSVSGCHVQATMAARALSATSVRFTRHVVVNAKAAMLLSSPNRWPGHALIFWTAVEDVERKMRAVREIGFVYVATHMRCAIVMLTLNRPHDV